MAKRLSKTCNHQHVHQTLQGGRTQAAAFYSTELIIQLLRGIRDTWEAEGHTHEATQWDDHQAQEEEEEEETHLKKDNPSKISAADTAGYAGMPRSGLPEPPGSRAAGSGAIAACTYPPKDSNDAKQEVLHMMNVVAKHADLEEKQSWADWTEENEAYDNTSEAEDMFYMKDGKRIRIRIDDANFK